MTNLKGLFIKGKFSVDFTMFFVDERTDNFSGSYTCRHEFNSDLECREYIKGVKKHYNNLEKIYLWKINRRYFLTGITYLDQYNNE